MEEGPKRVRVRPNDAAEWEAAITRELNPQPPRQEYGGREERPNLVRRSVAFMQATEYAQVEPEKRLKKRVKFLENELDALKEETKALSKMVEKLWNMPGVAHSQPFVDAFNDAKTAASAELLE